MQQLIDCTMLCTPSMRAWAGQWVAGLADDRLRIRLVDVADDVGVTLETIHRHLHTSHLCLLPVSPDNLSWARTLLGQAAGSLFVPVMAVTHDLKAVALRDLFALRVADFLSASGSPDELRVRVERVLTQARTTQLDTLSRSLENTASTTATTVVKDANNKVSCPRVVHSYVMGRLVAPPSHRVAETARTQLSRYHHPVARQSQDADPQSSTQQPGSMELEVFAAATAAHCALRNEPFKQAKGRVVEGFEKAYLTAVLGRYGGNITQAAKAANKHRRAFWELVRKHQIDLSQYRAQEHM